MLAGLAAVSLAQNTVGRKHAGFTGSSTFRQETVALRRPEECRLPFCLHAAYTMYVKLRYRFRFYPTKPQQATLANVFGACRYVYNWGLRMRTDAFHAGAPIGYNQSSAKLTELRHTKETRWLESVSIVPIQQSLRHLNIAFLNFFEKRSAYPSFKKKRGKQCAEYTRSAFRWRGSARTITLSQLGALDIRWSREFASEPSTVTITKTPSGRYFATLVLDETPKRLPLCKEEAGIDLGINRLATLSNGERIANPRHLGLRLRQLKHASRCLSRRTKGSGRWQRQRLRVARLQERIADSRADHLHKVTTDLVRRFGTLYRGPERARHGSQSLLGSQPVGRQLRHVPIDARVQVRMVWAGVGRS